MRITDLVPGPGGIVPLHATDGDAAVRELGLALAPLCGIDGDRVVELLRRREHVASTAVGGHVAIPHARTAEASKTIAVVGLSRGGIEFSAPDNAPVHVFVALLSPIHGGRHLQAIAAIARDLAAPSLLRRLTDAASPDDAYALLSAAGSRG